jgi:hypothetical protein
MAASSLLGSFQEAQTPQTVVAAVHLKKNARDVDNSATVGPVDQVRAPRCAGAVHHQAATGRRLVNAFTQRQKPEQNRVQTDASLLYLIVF